MTPRPLRLADATACDVASPASLESAALSAWLTCAAALAAFLLDPLPSSLDALAIVVDEIAITLCVLRHLHATGRMRRVGP
jgi:hypothetical protein